MSKRMTLIIGAACTNGLYFCSDTEEGTVMGGKRSVHKLRDVSSYPSWHLVLGAAGFGPLCEIAMERIVSAALAGKKDFLAAPEIVIGQEMKKIYDQYVSVLLSEDKRFERQIQVVCGVADLQGKTAHLFQTHEEIVYPVTEPYVCAGVGQEIAHYFLDRLFKDWRLPFMYGTVPTTVEGERFLQFVMREAKNTVGGVGGNTETVTIDYNTRFVGHGSFGSGWDAKQPQLQDVIRHFWRNPLPKRSGSRKSKRVP